MATAGGSGVSGAAAGTTNQSYLSADQLRGYLMVWGIPAPRVALRSKRLAEVGVTLKGLAVVAVLPLDVWLPFLIGKREGAKEGDKFDALLIMAGATKATAAAAAAASIEATPHLNQRTRASTFASTCLWFALECLFAADYVVMALVLLVLLQAALALVLVQTNRRAQAQRVKARAKARAACTVGRGRKPGRAWAG